MKRNSKEYKDLKTEIAKAALQGMLSNSHIMFEVFHLYKEETPEQATLQTMNHVVNASVLYAETLIRRLKT